MRHARDYSRDLFWYSRSAGQIEPEVAKSKSEQLAKNVDAATKDLAVARKHSDGEKRALAELDAIEKHLAKAAEIHKALHTECCKDSVMGSVCAGHCSAITKELDLAIAEHDALMRALDFKASSGTPKDGR